MRDKKYIPHPHVVDWYANIHDTMPLSIDLKHTFNLAAALPGKRRHQTWPAILTVVGSLANTCSPKCPLSCNCNVPFRKIVR